MPMRAPLNLGDHASLARRIVGELVGSAGIRVLGMAVSFLVGVQLARYLGPGGYGMYGTAMAIAALVAVPAQMGLPQLITRELSVTVARRDARAAKTLLLWFTAIVAAASLVVSALGLAGLLLWSDVDATLRRAIGWGLATVPIMALLSLAGGALRGLHDVVTAQAFDAAIRPLGLAALLASVAIVGSIDAATAMALHALAALLALVMSVQRVRRVTPHAVRVAPVTRFDRSMVRGSGAMFGTEALRVLDGQYAVLLLGLIATAEEVGWYRAAIAVAVFMALPLTIVNLVVMPHVARLHAQSDLRRLQLVASGAAVAMLSIATVVTLAVYFLGEQLLVALFGHDFLPVWEPLILMCVAYTVSAFFGAAAIVLTMVGQERMVMAVHLVGPVVGVCLTLALFATLGISAAAIGMIVAEAIKGAWLAQVARRTLGLDVTLLSAGSLRNRG